MSGKPERPHVGAPSALSAEVSLDFECSFAAADANQAVQNLLDESYERAYVESPQRYFSLHTIDKNVQIVGEDVETHNTQVITRRWYPINAEQPAELAVIRHRGRQSITLPDSNMFSRIFSRQVKAELRAISAELDRSPDEPVLAVVFDDVALPLASFARRRDGQCSYVQIGSEIKDDNFHLLATDDQTGRHVIIEAVKTILGEEYDFGRMYMHHKLEGKEPLTAVDKQHQRALRKLVKIECNQNREQLTAAFEAQLVRKSMTELGTASRRRRLVVVGENDERWEDRFDIKTLVADTRLADDRTVELILAKPHTGANQDVAHIMALSRRQVALPVATLNASTGQVRFENPELETDVEQRQAVVFKLLSILRGEPLVRHNSVRYLDVGEADQEGSSDDARSRVKSKLIDMFSRHDGIIDKLRLPHMTSRLDYVVTHFFNIYSEQTEYGKGIFERQELKDVFLESGYGDLAQEVRPKLFDFFTAPLYKTNPYPESKVLAVAIDRLNRENQARLDVLDQFNVQARFADILGGTSILEEALINQIFKMSVGSEVHRGVIKNVELGNADTDIDFQVEIERQGSGYQITSSRRPDSMKDEVLRLSPTFCFSYDITRPIKEQLGAAQSHIQEAVDHFKQLEPVKQEVVTK